MIKKKLKGSLTIETALVFPLVVFGIIFIIFFILLIFCRINTAMSVNKICNEISGTYYDAYGTFGRYSNAGPSGGIITEAISEALFSRSRKEETIREEISNQIQNRTPIKLDISANVDIHNFVIWQSVDIEVNVKYPLIVGWVFEMFTDDPRFSGGTFNESYKRIIVVSSTESNIRSMDYLGEKISDSGIIDDTISLIKSKISSIFGGSGGGS